MFRKIIKGLKDVWCGTLEFDTEPKKGSFNPVTSDGVYDAINGSTGAKEIVYFDVDPSDPPSGIYAAITEALSNNKEPVIKNDGTVYFYSSTSTGKYIFVGGYDTCVVKYMTVTVSENDSVVKETVDTIEGMVFPLYYHSEDEGFTVADKTGHALTKTEIADAYRAGQIFMFSSYPASNTQAHWGYCCDINIDSDNTGYAEFFILAAFGGNSYEWEKYRINLSSNTEFVTLWGPNTSYSTGYSGSYANASDVAALQSQVSSLSDVSVYSAKGEATVAQLNAGPSGIQAGWAYQLTDSGTLTDGSLAVVAGDTVAWDGTKWFPLVKSDYYATKTYAQNVARSIAPAFDPTRDEDHKYLAGEIVTYTDGKSYRFKVDHYGPWNSADVVRYDAGESLKFFVVTNNPEYLYAITDKDGRFLLGIKKDGSFDWATGIPQPVKDSFVNKEVGKSLINSDFASTQSSIANPEFLQVMIDLQGKLISALNPNGQQIFFSKPIFKSGIDWSKDNLTELGKVLYEKGVMIGLGDWSNSQSLKIPLPDFGIVNINGSVGMPYTKTQDLNVEFEFWDLNGNYFKKPAVINAQGNSSLRFPKRNVAVDLLNADGSSFKLKIGDWVTQDSFHLKSYYTDITRVRALAGYYLFKEIMDAKGPRHDRTWKDALWKNTTYIGVGGGVNADSNLKTQFDDGAVCFPLGFPIALYYNGAFYGIFCWQLKKHRDNYMMKKSDAKAIHLDGDMLGQDFFRYGNIDWTGFEVRNPKDLVCMDGSAYDGDNPKELIDSTSPYYDGTKKSHKNSKAVKESIIRLSQAYSVISQQATTDEKKAKIAEYFDVDNIIDYQIFNDFVVNGDAFEKNWQWTTWDGEHWFVNPYDLDGMTGVRFTGDSVAAPPATYGGNQTGKPNWLIITYYQDALNSRYAQLRQSGILSVKNVMDKISKLVLAVGMDNYEKEFEKWPDTPCNNDLNVNTDYWEVEVDEAGNPVMNKDGVAYYNAQTEYTVGDECLYAVEQGVAAKYTMRCTNNSIGNQPVLTFAFRDSYERMINYLTLNQQLKDTLYGYQGD